MSYKRRLPIPKDTAIPREQRVTWTYYVSRDSVRGELSGSCSLWFLKPTRVKVAYRVTWVASDDRNTGYLGEYRLDNVESWFRVVPETDLELLKVEQYATAKMLAEAAERAK